MRRWLSKILLFFTGPARARRLEARAREVLWRQELPLTETIVSTLRAIERALPGGLVILQPSARAGLGPDALYAEAAGARNLGERPAWRDHLRHYRGEAEEETFMAGGAGPAPRLLSLPLLAGGTSFGGLHLFLDKIDFILSAKERALLRDLARQLALRIENEALKKSTRVDTLTGLYNRGHLSERLREERTRSSRSGAPFTFLMLDVDHFKRVNDRYGHPAGDELLLELARRLQRSCRASDAVFRYGGDEIAIVLADTPLSGARTFAENLRRNVAATPLLTWAVPAEPVTVSLGLAEFRPGEGASAEELVRRADEALYAAKHAGRNRVVARDR